MFKLIKNDLFNIVNRLKSIDKKYFVYGDVYRLKLGTNRYVNAICIEVNDASVKFGYHNKESFDIIELSIGTLMYGNNYDIKRLKVDYENGVFKFKQ